MTDKEFERSLDEFNTRKASECAMPYAVLVAGIAGLAVYELTSSNAAALAAWFAGLIVAEIGITTLFAWAMRPQGNYK